MLTTSARLLVASAAAASLVTLASSPALAYDHLIWGYEFLDNAADSYTDPNANTSSADCSIDWDNYIGHTQAACFFGRLLMKAQGYGNQDMWNHFGMNMPSSARYYNLVTGAGTPATPISPYLLRITNISQLQAGDLVVFAKTATYSGHTAIVTGPALEIDHPICPVYADTKQWKVPVMDSSGSAHGCTDTRFIGQCYPYSGSTDGGAGEGNMRFYTQASTNTLKGHTWSVTSNCVMPSPTYYGEVTRPYVFARLQGLQAPVSPPPPPPPPPPVSE